MARKRSLEPVVREAGRSGIAIGRHWDFLLGPVLSAWLKKTDIPACGLLLEALASKRSRTNLLVYDLARI